jgi:DNA transformation protein and related proteins
MSSKSSSPKPAAKPRDKFVDFLVERFSVLGKVAAKSMFGGYGFYCDGLFFAIYDGKHVYLKGDGQTIPAFADRGLPAFQPFDDQPMTMKYWRAPEEMLEDDDALRQWAGEAIATARRAAKKKPGKKKNKA